jgi:hypothetical protein
MNENYEDLNETELVELCKQRSILVAHRGLGRKTLEGLLKGSVNPDDCEPDPVDEDRDFMLFTQAHHPEKIRGQLQCRDEDYFCPDCPTGRVVECTIVNMDTSLRRSMVTEMLLERQKLTNK